jgi:hypothetical protein
LPSSCLGTRRYSNHISIVLIIALCHL